MGSLDVLFLIPFLILSIHGLEGDIISSEGDLEVEKQIKLLNKPSLKTIKDEAGDIYDCVDVMRQPALDHPLLKNHQIKMRPTSRPKESSSRIGTPRWLKKQGRGIGCPQGTVPIRRTQKEDLLRAKSLLQESLATDSRVMHTAVFRSRLTSTIYTGLEARFSMWNPKVDAKEQWSSAELSVENGPKEDLNSIKAGWTVSPQLYGDNKTRTYVYWQGQGNKGGCYNFQCPGYVQINNDYPMGRTVPTSYGYPLRLYQDQVTKDWWLDSSEMPIIYGYFPRELFPHLEGGTPTISFGGMTKRASYQPNPPMGSGYFPHGIIIKLDTHAGYFANIKVFKGSNDIRNDPDPDLMETFTDAPKCYSVEDYGVLIQYGYTIVYGGPGNCGT